MNTHQAFAVLLGRWADFYSWLVQQTDFDHPVLREHLHGGLHADSGFCPIHGGSSGEAWRFYRDAHINGGCVCNTCGSFSQGVAFLTRLFDEARVLDWTERFVKAHRINLPAEGSLKRVWQWHTASDPHIAAHYLKNRGLSVSADTLPESVRGHRRFKVFGPKREDYGERPVLLTLIRDVDGNPATYQMIVLNEQGGKALDIPPAHVKRTAGINVKRGLRHSYAELGAPAANVLVLGEGVETVLAVLQALCALGLKPMGRATLGGGAGTLLEQPVPEGVTTVLIAADVDMYETLLSRANQRGGMTFEGAHKVYIAVPEAKGNPKRDWLDVLVEDGQDAVSDGFAEPLFIHEGVRVDHPGARGGRENILDLTRIAQKQLFARLDTSFIQQPPEHWYRHRGQLVDVSQTRLNALHGFAAPTRDEICAEVEARFSFYGANGYQSFPDSTATRWWSRPEFIDRLMEKLPELKGVRRSPALLTRTGAHWQQLTTHAANGYDRASGLYFALPDTEQALWDEAAGVSRTVAWGLGRRLVNEVLGEACFAYPCDKANALAALFAPLLAPAVPRVPLIVANAAALNGGQVALLRRLTYPWGEGAWLDYTNDDRQLSERVANAYATGNPLLCLYGLTGPVNARLLSALVERPETTVVKSKTLDRTYYPPAGLTVFGLASRPQLASALRARVLPIRLRPSTLNPGVDGLPDPAIEETPVAVPAQSLRRGCYKILRAWLADGAPILQAPNRLAGYELWSDLTYSLLVYIGAPEAAHLLGASEQEEALAETA